jgi:ATP-dependent protease ClpP protease subunit
MVCAWIKDRAMTPHLKMRLQNKGKGEFRAEANTIWLYDAIAADEDEAYWLGGIAPMGFIAALKACDGPVTLRINSPGGSVFGAQAMVAAMREFPHAITAQVDAIAASAASVIAVECARCVMVPGAQMMIHKAWGLVVGNEDDLRQTADLLAKIDGQIAGSYARKTGKDAADYEQKMRSETWFTPEEAVAEGLADEVKAGNTQRTQARWDLSAFSNPPEVPAELAASDPKPDPQPEPEALPDLTPTIDPAPAVADRQRKLAARLVANPI